MPSAILSDMGELLYSFVDDREIYFVFEAYGIVNLRQNFLIVDADDLLFLG
jgi:hypothetical protein